ncbi:hypothetical protein ACEXQB_007620 [Herbiconiux sp. P18]|uniref:hypothetical protein n=1 Tax=Herbiconiux liangxiaofengii TaxID=3342795 RepID=UPI0035B8EC79
MDPIFWIPIGLIFAIAIGMTFYAYWRGEKSKLDVEKRAELEAEAGTEPEPGQQGRTAR